MEERFGYRTGLIIPIHGPGDAFAMLSAAGDGPKSQYRKISLQTIATTQLLAFAFRERERSLVLPKVPAALDPPLPVLSTREGKCLGWCSAGKTNWEIAQILGVSERTAKKHVESAMRKLGAKTRGQAAFRASELGLIKP
jgi:DNA-binding CsgD family transcriptional regulator